MAPEANPTVCGATREAEVETATETSSDSPPSSREGSQTDLQALDVKEIDVPAVVKPVPSSNKMTAPNNAAAPPPLRKGKSLRDRSRVPASFYIAAACLFGSHIIIGFYSLETLVNWKESMVHAGCATRDGLVYIRTLMKSVYKGTVAEWSEVLTAAIFTCLIASTLTLLIGAPLRAGFWTGPRTRKHIVHRYMGMAFLIQYAAAWVEYITNYDHAKDSVLLHFIAVNGLIQGYSAFFSFKVLPDLDDPGYFSDKAVISRKFVHENTFFSLITVWGSIYYNEVWLEKIQAHPVGRILEILFVFFAYVAIRPFFPTTHVGDAGSGKGSRTDANKSFYTYGTLAYKIFYLWAKYFLGFFINFLWMRRLCTPDEVMFIKGMYTLNLGTLSIGIFLHTLRFKGVLPGKLTFSLYLLQIYATFSAIPLAFNLFASHKMLCGAMFVGILANMTRRKWVHAAWCCTMLYLIKFREDVDW